MSLPWLNLGDVPLSLLYQSWCAPQLDAPPQLTTGDKIQGAPSVNEYRLPERLLGETIGASEEKSG